LISYKTAGAISVPACNGKERGRKRDGTNFDDIILILTGGGMIVGFMRVSTLT